MIRTGLATAACMIATANVTDMGYMFNGCTAIATDDSWTFTDGGHI
jgi:hypothetical protein